MSGRSFTLGGNVARGLAAAAPLLAAGVGCLTVLVGIPGASRMDWPRTASFWVLVAAAVLCAVAVTPILWQGIRNGRLALWILLALGLAPWALGVVLAFVQLGQGIRALAREDPGSLLAYAGTPQQTRLVGALLSWSLLGATAAALAIASFLWRAPGGRWRNAGLGLLGATPFAAFVAWGLARGALGPLAVGFAGAAFLAMPLWLALGGAALGDSPRTHPQCEWVLGVPLTYLVWALAATTMVTGFAALDALAGLSIVRTLPMALIEAARQDVASAGWVRLVAVLLAAVPFVVLAMRVYGRKWLSTATAGRRVPLAAVALLVTLDVVLGAHPIRQIDQLARTPVAPKVPPGPVAQDRLVAPVEVPEEIKPEEGLDLGVEGGVPGGVVGGVVGGPPGASPPPVQAVRVGGQIKEPKKLKHVNPTYPEIAKQARVSALVILEVEVDTRGLVKTVKVLRGHPLFDDAAVSAVRQWVYAPTLLNGVPVPVIMTVTVNFMLR